MEWDPTQFFRDDHTPTCLTVCADGGANRFYGMMKASGRESIELPNLIIGDLDSIHPTTRTHYENLGVRVIEDKDQYSTDFTKCLTYLRSYGWEYIPSPAPNPEADGNEHLPLDVLILGGLGGRVDQAFSQIHHLYLMTQQFSSPPSRAQGTGAGNLYLISEESITFILHPGVNRILTPGTKRPDVGGSSEEGGKGEDAYLLEENVGIIPLSGPAWITTRGFQWDVEDWKTEIGGQISTSNHIRSDVVVVESAVSVLFTLELAGRFKRVR
ncbi:hypothetical protein BBP40_006739 [Aspergillus hancockii]|nr:hypothetical protein BBP40_006739 [Aspergillus hancockii]